VTEQSGDSARDEQRVTAQREAAAVWDRVGGAMQGGSELYNRMSKANLELWQSVSARLREAPYTADDLTTDAMRAAAIALRTAGEAWSLFTTPPDTRNVARAVPTVLLVFKGVQAVDPVLIRVAAPDPDRLPPEAVIVLQGEPREGVARLQDVLSARRDPAEPATYRLEGQGSETLIDGNYGGFVYLPDPPQLLADLRISVTGSTSTTTPG
jgi:hypothetical protein